MTNWEGVRHHDSDEPPVKGAPWRSFSESGERSIVSSNMLLVIGGAKRAAALHGFLRPSSCIRESGPIRRLSGSRCPMNNLSLKHQIGFDWWDDVFK